MNSQHKERVTRILSHLKSQPITTELIASKVIDFHLSPLITEFIQKYSLSIERFVAVISHCELSYDGKLFFGYKTENGVERFRGGVYENKEVDVSEPVIIVYICHESEDREFGIIETVLQIHSQEEACFSSYQQ
ncbi:hypothetical protein EDB29_101623 [Vibrio crassostreae]|uniref:hypothetical protein n=1 Tax=Vibrio crassostreae TaxID=246167 RepID=UPI00104E7372|nr:hypothetical protein [Vibrio crassostreae]TCT43815.1 hypothetical protein EDB29_101623 [Vibrio crassostreae]